MFTLAACSATTSATTVSGTTNTTSNTTTVSNSEATTTVSTPAASVADALAENKTSHEDAKDVTWDEASVISITLNGDAIEASGAGVAVEGSTVTITAAGTYRFTGTLNDGQILVNTQDTETVRLILNGVDIQNSTTAPIYVAAADEVVIVLADNTANQVSDGSNYVYATSDTTEPNAAIFSLADLTIFGDGSLTVTGNYNDGISSKDGLVIQSGTLTVTAVDDGIRGKDYVVVEDGNLTIRAQGDGLVSDNEEDATRGYISIEGGVLEITSGGDAIQAMTDVLITAGDFTLTSGGGSSARVDETSSAKAIKGVVSVSIDGGTFVIDSSDDAIHSNNSVTINAGTFSIASADDGIHADTLVTINNGTVDITKSYEGIESATIIINAGDIQVVASDDGINIAGGNDASGMPGGGGQGQDMVSSSGKLLTINGGTIAVDAYGDGLDINGSIEMTGGVVLVTGPTEQMNGAIDYDGTFNISGGTLVATGSSGMAMAPSASSSQNSVMIFFSATQPAGTQVRIENSAGEELISFTPTREFQSLAFSSPKLTQGATYNVTLNGSQYTNFTVPVWLPRSVRVAVLVAQNRVVVIAHKPEHEYGFNEFLNSFISHLSAIREINHSQGQSK